MSVRGSSDPNEFKRVDTAFYKGIVIRNDDPLGLYRVKVYIPELSNQFFEEWFEKYEDFNLRFPGINNEKDNWVDTDIFKDLAGLIPWAEPCFPLMGEGGPARYSREEKLAVISDTNVDKVSDLRKNDEEPPTEQDGVFGPAWFYENYNTTLSDKFRDPITSLATNNNPYSFLFRPSKHVNECKGVFGVPSIGTKVWVFHYNGDINFPVYMGTRHDFRETSLINDFDQPDCDNKSLDYPSVYENGKQTSKEIVPKPA